MTESAADLAWRGAVRRVAGIALIAILSAACAQPFELHGPGARDVPPEHAALLDEIRAFERKFGFRRTGNFRAFLPDREAYTYCGYVSPLYLPYSYEDPAIRWLDSVTEEKCRSLAGESDVSFGAVEAQGEAATPVTASMVGGALDRFVYLVIHEDCHDQFDFPYGIEEALCNLIAYKAMIAFGEQKFGAAARESEAIRRYADGQAQYGRVIIGYYARLAALYARHERAEISPEVLLRERAVIFSHAEQALDWQPGDMNNVVIANEMTYRRHYPFLETIYEALGSDLRRVVRFFRQVDRKKLSPAAVMERHAITVADSVEFIRAYEDAMVETVTNLQSAQAHRAISGRRL